MCVNKWSNIEKSQVPLTTQVLMEAQSTVSMISEKNTPNSHSLDPLCESKYTLSGKASSLAQFPMNIQSKSSLS